MTVSPPGTPEGHHTTPGVMSNFAPASPAFSGPPSYAPPTRGRRSILTAVSITITLLIATAALIMAVIAVNRPSPTPAASKPSTTVPTATGDTTEADRELCTNAGPLLRERADIGKAFVNTGETGSPERDSAIPKFREQVEGWAARIQPVVDANRPADSFLSRTLQRMIDDTVLYAESIRPGPATEYDKLAWNDSVVAYGGPFFRCHQLGVTW